MQSLYEQFDDTYETQGDYLIPNLTLPTEPRISTWKICVNAQNVFTAAQASVLSKFFNFG